MLKAFKLILLFLVISCSFVKSQTNAKHYLYDKADLVLTTEKFGSTESYDADHVINGNKMYSCWLEFVPEKGDFLWVGKWLGGKALWKKKFNEAGGKFKNPKILITADGKIVVTFEREEKESKNWNIYMTIPDKGNFSEPFLISKRNGINLNHDVALDSKGGLWCTWQMANIGQFDVVACHIPDLSNPSIKSLKGISSLHKGDWIPSIAINQLDEILICWDSYTNPSNGFDLVAKKYDPGRAKWGDTIKIATTKAFEGKSDVVTDEENNFIIIWEVGGEHWGERYIGNRNGYRINQMDGYGSLHRFRFLKLAKFLTLENRVEPFPNPLPMPMLKWAHTRENLKPGTSFLGCFYERAKLNYDKKNRLWVTYRQFYAPQVGFIEDLQDGYEEGWKVYSRYLSGNNWSGLIALDSHQRDGDQSLSTFVNEKGISFLYTIGRTANDKPSLKRGVYWKFVDLKKIPSNNEEENPDENTKLEPGVSQIELLPKFKNKKVKVDSYNLYFGDLHRHSDLSNKFTFFDGSVIDNYRYATEVGKLDFVALTDYSHDLSKSNPNSQVWWRSIKEISRFQIPYKMVSYCGFVKTNENFEHHVVSTNPLILSPPQQPITEFWQRTKDTTTISITHRFKDKPKNKSIKFVPINKLWKSNNEIKRPLLEIYQGLRHDTLSSEFHRGLANGYHVGVSGGSGHLSTAGSFTGVWAKNRSKRDILNAIISRRTFAATTKMSLIFKCGDHWMGEVIKSSYIPEFQLKIESPISIKRILLISGGEVIKKIEIDSKTDKMVDISFVPSIEYTNKRYFYIKVEMADENWAWSSPIWLEKW